MLNRWIGIGRLGKDPDLSYSDNGTAICKMCIAVERPWKTDEVDWIDVVAFKKQAENCANHLGKGRLIAVEGRLQTRSYEDNNGIRRKVAEVVAENVRFLDWPKDEQKQSPQESSNKALKQEDDIDVPF